jgi:hypothetical protein
MYAPKPPVEPGGFGFVGRVPEPNHPAFLNELGKLKGRQSPVSSITFKNGNEKPPDRGLWCWWFRFRDG